MKKILILAMIITVSVTLYCQDKKEIKEKLKSLKGDVKEITIKTDKETITFKGKEAEYVFKNIKKQKEKEMKFVITSGDDDDEVIYLNGDKFDWVGCDSLSKMKMIKLDWVDADSILNTKKFKFDFNIDDSSIVYKNMNIEINDGNKKLIIIEKDKNGNETEKIYEGEEAEKKLKEMEKEGKLKKHVKKVIIHEKDDIKNDKQ